MRSQSLVQYGEPLVETSRTVPVPTGSEVLVRITHCGVCHSDIHLQDGHFDLGGGKNLDIRELRTLPFTLGHEIAGVVEALGPDAKGLKIGERYAVYPWIGCHRCKLCERGDEQMCSNPRALGVSVDGGYATHVLVPDSKYCMDVTGIPPELAGSYMCSGLTAYGALKKALRYEFAGPLMIVGLGGVGSMGLQLAKAMFKVPIYVADTDPKKREAAMAFGAAGTFDPADPNARKTVFQTTGAGVGASVDFVGSDKSFNFAQSVVAKGGAAVVVGLFGGAFSIPVPMFPLRALTLMGSYVSSLTEAEEMLALVKAGKVAPIPVELRPMDQVNRTLDDLRNGRVLGRVVLTP